MIFVKTPIKQTPYKRKGKYTVPVPPNTVQCWFAYIYRSVPFYFWNKKENVKN
jgi:hypothetical protein